jgi:PilZ domain
MEMIKERRKSPRTDSDLPLDIYDPKGRMVVGEGRFINLSTNGGLMVSRKPLKPHAAVRLHVVPVGKSALELIGKVVWARKKTAEFEYGIRFSQESHIPQP